MRPHTTYVERKWTRNLTHTLWIFHLHTSVHCFHIFRKIRKVFPLIWISICSDFRFILFFYTKPIIQVFYEPTAVISTRLQRTKTFLVEDRYFWIPYSGSIPIFYRWDQLSFHLTAAPQCFVASFRFGTSFALRQIICWSLFLNISILFKPFDRLQSEGWSKKLFTACIWAKWNHV